MGNATIIALANALNFRLRIISSSVFSLEKKIKTSPQLNPAANSLKSRNALFMVLKEKANNAGSNYQYPQYFSPV